MWFEDLVGFPETDGDAVRTHTDLQGEVLRSRLCATRAACGTKLDGLRSADDFPDGKGFIERPIRARSVRTGTILPPPRFFAIPSRGR